LFAVVSIRLSPNFLKFRHRHRPGIFVQYRSYLEGNLTSLTGLPVVVVVDVVRVPPEPSDVVVDVSPGANVAKLFVFVFADFSV
jgi:hypothetical protein